MLCFGFEPVPIRYNEYHIKSLAANEILFYCYTLLKRHISVSI